jgi:hypothetical protein
MTKLKYSQCLCIKVPLIINGLAHVPILYLPGTGIAQARSTKISSLLNFFVLFDDSLVNNV